jgi:hypothetical protein
MTTVVISQPMLFPWVGLFEQIALADVYVHYTDVAWSDSGFVHRVQIRNPSGRSWLGIPIRRGPLGTPINELQAADTTWPRRHLDLLAVQYRATPYVAEMMELAGAVYERANGSTLAAMLVDQLETTCRFLDIGTTTRFEDSTSIAPTQRSSQRVLDIVNHFGGTTYVTGHGASRYLDHSLFDVAGVEVRYMDYAMKRYPQLHGDFTPYVSILDLIANVGRDRAHEFIAPRTVHWREFCARSAA